MAIGVAFDDLHDRIVTETFDRDLSDRDAFLLFTILHEYQIELTESILSDHPQILKIHALTQRGCSETLAALWSGTEDPRRIPEHWYWLWNTDWGSYGHAENLTDEELERRRQLVEKLESHPFVNRIVPDDDEPQAIEAAKAGRATMTEDEFVNPEIESKIVVAPEVDSGVVALSEIEFVIPAPAYHSIATDDKAAEIPEAKTVETLAPIVEGIASLGDGLNRKIDALQTMFDRELRAEATREKVVDRLHAELQEYKQGLLLGILKPVFVDLIQLHDDMGKMVAAQGESTGEVARLLAMIVGFQQGIEDILYRQGVEPFTLEGDAFDPRKQRALSTVPTDDASKNKQVATRLRKGFQSEDKVIRPEMVTVYAFKEKVATTTDLA